MVGIVVLVVEVVVASVVFVVVVGTFIGCTTAWEWDERNNVNLS